MYCESGAVLAHYHSMFAAIQSAKKDMHSIAMFVLFALLRHDEHFYKGPQGFYQHGYFECGLFLRCGIVRASTLYTSAVLQLP